MNPTIVVVGSSNTDMVVKTDRLPAPGETIIGERFFMNAGGKGANQAVAAARLGGDVTLIAKTGNDIFGSQSVDLFKKEKIDTSYMVSDPDNPSGVALITVDRHAENCIVVASGANATLLPADLAPAINAIGKAGIVLMQLEIPLSTVEYAASIAAASDVKVILNPAPMCVLSDHLLRNIFLLTPNTQEAEMLTGLDIPDLEAAKAAAAAIHERGVQHVIITLGAKGALLLSEGIFTLVPATAVEAVDTTAAGDVFNGALAVAIAEGFSLAGATTFACRAAAISVTRLGAQSSAPYRAELDSPNPQLPV